VPASRRRRSPSLTARTLPAGVWHLQYRRRKPRNPFHPSEPEPAGTGGGGFGLPSPVGGGGGHLLARRAGICDGAYPPRYRQGNAERSAQ
jgi:hypothetical protein